MKRARSTLLFLVMMLATAFAVHFFDRSPVTQPAVDKVSIPGGVATRVYFSPNGGATEAVTREIDGARESILVQAYSFTSAPIAKALLAAHKRGVKVQALLDKSQRREKYTSANFLANSGIPTYIDDAHAIAHNKVMVIDNATVITGSFNFTKAAEEKNAENLLVLRSGDLARLYADNWRSHLRHSEALEGRY
jgi:phosphatidylserine/phosphatidylglycerophosphate/cardiolipin synthase-like enzyme